MPFARKPLLIDSYWLLYLLLKKSLKKYLESNIAIMAAIAEEKETSIIAFVGSKIIPARIPSINATGTDSDNNNKDIKKKYRPDSYG